MYYKLFFIFSLLFTIGCSKKVIRQPYHYPNYNIIKPEVTCRAKRKNIQKLLLSYLGKPYVWAEEGPDAFDCSGLTYNIYGKMGITIPRTASEQSKMGKHVAFGNLQYGDLIFFGSANRRSRRISHVGIYLGRGWFAQASSSDRKVTVTRFTTNPGYYLKRVKTCRRYLSLDERSKYMTCDLPLRKMKITDKRYTTPWKAGMGLPRRAVPRH